MWKIEKIIKKGEYLYCIVRDHPRRTKNDYVLLHRVVVENHLGRLLTPDEVVHHKDGDKFNNSIDNLEVLGNSQHVREHKLENGQSWVDLKCPQCDLIFSLPRNQTFIVKGYRWTACSKSCRGKFSRKIQLHGLTAEVEIAISGNLVREYKKYSHDNPEETVITGSVETTRDQPEMAKI